MNNQELKTKVVSLLKTDARHVGMWAQEPSAMYIPFKRNRESFFVLVSLCLHFETKNFDDVAYACLSTLRLLINGGVLAGAPAVEIVPYSIEGQKTTRLLRLSIEVASLNDAMKLSRRDLLGDFQRGGIRCKWYVKGS